MSHRLLVVPTAHGVGLTSVCLGIARALDRQGVRYGFFKPVGPEEGRKDRSSELIRLVSTCDPAEPIPRDEVERLLGEGDEAGLLEKVMERIEPIDSADVIVVEGILPYADVVYASRLNVMLAKALDAELVLVGTPGDVGAARTNAVKIADNIDIASRGYGLGGEQRSVIVNRVPAELDHQALVSALVAEGYRPLGIIPHVAELQLPRVKDLAEHLDAKVLHAGAWTQRRIRGASLCAASVRRAVHSFARGTLVITPGDRDDIIIAACLASLEGVKLAGLLLTGGVEPEPQVLALCRRALDAGLPMLGVAADSYEAATAVHGMSREVPVDDRARAELAMETIAERLDGDWLKQLASSSRDLRMTTPAFRHSLVDRARKADRRIVLPEGDEPRIVEAAAIVARRRIARPVLLARRDSILRAAKLRGVDLPDSVEIVDPRDVVKNYIAPMVALRRHKGLTEAAAGGQLEDNVVLGTMMLRLDEVDGLVSGAVHTTANTIRPALQLIKTAPGASLVSSIFFMCLPEQVLVYGDCAVNPNPNAEQLAEIAIQSADSAAAFGIEPRVAMISYSTGTSGAGSDVDKVARATALAKAKRPDLCIDGPLQYDAAAIADVARTKAPDSPVAGRATVFVFPDLNTGNTTYKAVQRSAQVVSMGPMLQGLAKPVNDLSRGALVEDIVFTIALTAVQAARAVQTRPAASTSDR